ncbi:hypothetical protein SARC_03817 [Sphaeroforma arctica JP610]|uniref:Uncharacterized protein n=1 Tax=Sphaeroforma arctica JP610 TaxID=667725 RepID=A0A0L0G6U1_9EUKA|nr:hypothetical protein SARC_03817 [Sphaeroforma arctica JP610]KNC83953.1 hypothetical protein SARC_03817 [Sphaeroforma arctica JP610]|eukprot:XP_014157855.1 hypothetical protein SARC_03817 [Sphaeroforma arctica JP610]
MTGPNTTQLPKDSVQAQKSVQTISDADFSPKISGQTPSDAVSSEPQVAPTWITPTGQLPNNVVDNMKQISPESTTMVKSLGRFLFLEPADFHLDMDTPWNLSSRQQMNQGQVAANLFRDKLQRHRRPRSPEELQENCQDTANVPIDTISYRKYFPVHHDRYLEDPQKVKR